MALEQQAAVDPIPSPPKRPLACPPAVDQALPVVEVALPPPPPLVISGPSGCGKSTLLKKLFESRPGSFALSVSHTTRKPRTGEENGRHYWFVSRDEFLELKKEDGFVETAEYAGNLYGTSKKAIRDVGDKGQVCVLDIDLQGVKSIKDADLGAKFVFIMPPNFETLERRLRGRGTDTEAAIQQRLKVAREEIEYARQPGAHNLVIINDDLETAFQTLSSFVDSSFVPQ